MGLTREPHPDSKATKEREAKANPLGIGLASSLDCNSSNKHELSGTQTSKVSQQEQKQPVQTQETAFMPQSIGVADNNKQQPDDVNQTSNLYPKDTIRTVHGHTTKLNKEKQEKHIPGSSYHQTDKSVLTISLKEAQELINQFAGTGQFLNQDFTKERVDFGREIGMHYDPDDGTRLKTTMALIHYSKNGTHIVPAEPRRTE